MLNPQSVPAPTFPTQPRDIECDADSNVVQQLATWYWKACGPTTLPTRENVAPLRAALVAAGFNETDTEFAVDKIASRQQRNAKQVRALRAFRKAVDHANAYYAARRAVFA